MNFWPFNRGPSKRKLRNSLVALTGSLEQLQAWGTEVERERRDADTKLDAANLELITLRPEVSKLQADRRIAEATADGVSLELVGLRAALAGYGYPTGVEELRGRLSMEEELFLAMKRKLKEREDEEE